MVPYFDLANIVMLFLLTVVLVGVKFGRGPAVLSSVLNVAAFDFFFVPPRLTFAVSDFQYLVVFSVMLLVGLITGQLTSGVRFQAKIAAHRESRARALYEFARELSSALKTEQILEITRDFVERTFRAKAFLFLPDDKGSLQLMQPIPSRSIPTDHLFNQQTLSLLETGIAQWAFDHATPAGIGTDTLPANRFHYLPLVTPSHTIGILAILPVNRRWILIPEQHRQLETFATLAAIALERVHYSEIAQNVLVNMESERLRNSLLAAISHDLRTPLTTLVGLSESLLMAKSALNNDLQELVQDLYQESVRMGHMVSNLLEMARIQSDGVKLNLQWHSFEEVVGSVLHQHKKFFSQHAIETKLDNGLPLVMFDAVLMERVLWNLLENAVKYTPVNSVIEIRASVDSTHLNVSISDNGPGFPKGQEEAIFEKFTRGGQESATPGIGLGLAICRAIIKAHQGVIQAKQSSSGGAMVVFSLPLQDQTLLAD
jgi:two-component system sensor histidine kinase KdpD